jgi:hypothetical protein
MISENVKIAMDNNINQSLFEHFGFTLSTLGGLFERDQAISVECRQCRIEKSISKNRNSLLAENEWNEGDRSKLRGE